MTDRPNIHFFFQDVRVTLPPRKKLKAFIDQIFRKERKKLQALNYVFCTDEKLLKINQTYLSHNFYTDVITFNLSENAEEIIGEIYISAERVRENSISFNSTLKDELLRVIFHGALHLCGYTDDSEKQKVIMREKENLYLSMYIKTNRLH